MSGKSREVATPQIEQQQKSESARNGDRQAFFAFAEEKPEVSFPPLQPWTGKFQRLRPPVKAHGGKYYLAKEIVPILMSVRKHATEYLEPCVFGGSVFLALPKFEQEFVGDVNPDVVNLWRILSQVDSSRDLIKQVIQTPYTREVFEQARQQEGDSPVQQAVNFLIKQRFSRGGLGKTFAWSDRLRGGKPGDVNSWETFQSTELPKIAERAEGVNVMAEPCWWTVYESRERVQRLIYADPPYMKDTRTAKNAYGLYEMTRWQHFWLVAALKAHTGPAAISGYRNNDYDRWLHDWRRIDIDMPNNSGQGSKKQRRTESLWINW